MVNRRVALLGALAVAVLSGGACKPDLDGRPSLVTGPRVLAVRSEPAEVAPGAQVTYRALFTGPDPAVLSWALCGDRKPLTELGPVSPTCLVPEGSALTQLGNGATATAEVPKEVCRSFGPDTPAPLPGEPAGRPTDPGGTGGYYQPVRIALPDGSYATAETRLSCGVSGATQEQLAELTARARPNTNPEVASVTAAGAAVDTAFDAAAGARVALRVAWAACPTSPACGDGVCSDDELVASCPDDCTDRKGCTGAERYALFDPTARAVTTRREAMRVSWFAEAGEWDADRTGRDETDGTSSTDNVWTAPAAAGDVRLWVVLRDDRGGVGYRALVARVRLSPLRCSRCTRSHHAAPRRRTALEGIRSSRARKRSNRRVAVQ